jgi:hypothetical protein
LGALMAVAVVEPFAGPTVADLIGMPWDEYLAALDEQDASWRDEEAQKGMKALRLADSMATYFALLKGQSVPSTHLDQGWARRYRLL